MSAPDLKMRELIPDCPDCKTQPVTFIKGVPLCAQHVEHLTQLARTRDGRGVGTTTASVLAAICG